ncbi:MAG: DUF4249 domain-containing protein [Cyclobacteriaceae bacterium]|nr:DUF4249 domain-containing protein [Cyclobacteriaceae bacterium HetDA_MAG_MS6]
MLRTKTISLNVFQGLTISLILLGCLERVELNPLDFDNLLVVEGLITNQTGGGMVKLSRTFQLDQDNPEPVENALVWVISASGDSINFTEERPGQYQVGSGFTGSIGERYKLLISSSEGDQYASDWVEMINTPPIDSVYAFFDLKPTTINGNAGSFNFFVDSRSAQSGNQHYRLEWTATYELEVPNPSRFQWLGGNDFIAREFGGDNPELQVQICWQTDTSSQILVNESVLPAGGFAEFPVHSVDSESRKMLRGYSIEVTQYALTPESFDYWSLLAESTQQVGFLFDQQVGTVRGNISNITNPDEIVLGIFDAAEKVSFRRQYHPLDFRDQGYRRNGQKFVDCADQEFLNSAPDSLGYFMDQYGEEYEIAFFSEGIIAPPGIIYFRKECSNCTLYGSNQQPGFWEN